MAAEQRILVIDDDEDIGELIVSVAQMMGFQCEATTESVTFLERLSLDTNLILLDLLMPDMDGIELLRLLGKRKCKAGIVLMSGVGKSTIESAEKFAQVLGLFIVGHLNKPFGANDLEQILHKVPYLELPPAILPGHQVSIHKEEFKNALKHNEFVVYYQPQINILSGLATGVEALVRWRHPQRGLIFPDGFIPRMEKLGLIDELGWAVADRAMSEVGQLNYGTAKALSLSLNAAVCSLRTLTFPDTLVALATRHGVQAENITIEITESGLIKELSSTLDTLTRLRMKQVQISVDDFGTGYATMQQFRNIPATELKIDKSFVQEMTSSQKDCIMVRQTIEMGHELGLQVVAEGVETPEQLALLRSFGCDSAQGYLFSRPIPAIEMVGWLKIYRAQLFGSHSPSTQLGLFDRTDSGTRKARLLSGPAPRGGS